MAWIGSSDIDSEEFKITESTSVALIVVLGDNCTSAAGNRSVCLRILTLLKKSCPDIYGQIIPTLRVNKQESNISLPERGKFDA